MITKIIKKLHLNNIVYRCFSRQNILDRNDVTVKNRWNF